MGTGVNILLAEMETIKGKQVDSGMWADFLSSNVYASPFQSEQFYEFINSVTNFSADVFAVKMKSELQALCIVTIQKEKGLKSFFSRRAIIYGGPLISDNENGPLALTMLINSINNDLHEKVIYIETRNQGNYNIYNAGFAAGGWRFMPHLNFRIELDGRTVEEVLQAMKYNRRREIRLSLKTGARYREAENPNEVACLYSVLYDLYQKRVRLPLPPLEYFERLYKSAIGKVFIVMYNNTIVGGAFCFFYPGISISTLYYCGRTDVDKNIFPAHLAVMAAIEFGISNKLRFIDLMGAGKPDSKYGVRLYKSGFGGKLEENGRYLKIFRPFLYSMGKAALTILKKI